MPELTFTVLGKPEPAGSKRIVPIMGKGRVPTGRYRVVDDNPAGEGWRKLVVKAAERARGEAPAGMFLGPLEGAVRVTMSFYVARPKGHFGTGRNAACLKPSAPPVPIVRPDSLKLARGTEDALTGVIWKDDAQVTDLVVHKRYAECDANGKPVIGCLIVVRWEAER